MTKEDDFVKYVVTMHTQNLNGRESVNEIFEEGVKACLNELKDDKSLRCLLRSYFKNY